mgnify:CR=1 FL=1
MTDNEINKENNTEDDSPETKNESDEENTSNHDISGGNDEDEETNAKSSELENDTSEESSSGNDLLSYEELSLKVDELKDQLLRTVAESENLRRRMEREKADSSKYAVTNFARSILSVADNLNRALDSVTDDARSTNEELDNLVMGIEMTSKELDNIYEKFEIKPIDALGKKFDHNLHQAMFEIDDQERPAGIVVQQVQKGYTIVDRLLRPAMVGVSKGGPDIEVEADVEKVDLESETLSQDTGAKETSSAYAKQAEATKQKKTKSPKLDKKL